MNTPSHFLTNLNDWTSVIGVLSTIGFSFYSARKNGQKRFFAACPAKLIAAIKLPPVLLIAHESPLVADRYARFSIDQQFANQIAVLIIESGRYNVVVLPGELQVVES